MKIETKRMILIPMTYDFVCDKLDRKESLLEKQGITISKEYWESSDAIDILPILKEGLSKSENPDGFGAWLFISKDNNRVVGNGGFHGEPDDNGVVEIGYEIDPDCRRQGYAAEAVSALINWAKRNNRVHGIKADCNVDNTASIGVLRNLGMKEIKRDSMLIYWELDTHDR